METITKVKPLELRIIFGFGRSHKPFSLNSLKALKMISVKFACIYVAGV
jgi:hypothetical protein